MKLEIIEKAWRLNLYKTDSQYFYDDCQFMFQNNSRNVAKKEILDQIKYEDILTNDGDEITYTNIPICRFEEYDIVNYKGKPVARYKIKQIEKEEKEDEKRKSILENEKYCWIVKRGEYYRDDMRGYTSNPIFAGIYSTDVAYKHVLGIYSDTMTLEKIDFKLLNKSIEDYEKDLEFKQMRINADKENLEIRKSQILSLFGYE